MKIFSESLKSALDRRLESLDHNPQDDLRNAETAIQILIPILERLKTATINYKFRSKTEEIIFFREIKPQFTSKLIYYNEIYSIELRKPLGTIKILRKYYQKEIQKIKSYFSENVEFFRYYRAGYNYLDKEYFTRGKHDIRLTLDSSYLQSDHRFATSHDYKLAVLLADDCLLNWLSGQIARLQHKATPPQSSLIRKLRWTGSKVALVELIYALHSQGVFNNGTSELKELAEVFEDMLDVNLGQFHRSFLEIRARKSERTKFLTTLKETLTARMDDADGIN